ncbi:MAG: hypothetical protein LBI42_05870 [Chitinispirillales bacterium]|jgi:uncharacterized membrane protein|nr:hypothetical protein [Chitinispirillales bacterium]
MQITNYKLQITNEVSGCGLVARTVILFFAAAVICLVDAQIIVEDEIITSDVNLFTVSNEKQRSIAAAMAASLVLPGAGHHYLDKPKHAFGYLAFDLASVFSVVLFNSLANGREKDARAFASAMAGIEKAPSGEAYWRHVGAFMDASQYNEVVELSRGSADDQYLDERSWWRWADESHQEEYNDIRQRARNLRVASSFFIGALVANRILSTVDLMVFRKKSMSSSIQFEPAPSPDTRGGSLTLKAKF